MSISVQRIRRPSLNDSEARNSPPAGPPPDLASHHPEEQAKFLKLGILILTPLIAFLGLVIFPMLVDDAHPADTAVFGASVVGTSLLAVAYLLAHKGFVRCSSVLAIAVTIMGPYVASYSIPSLLMFASVGTSLAVMLFSPQVVGALGIGSALLSLTLPIWSTKASYEAMIPLAGFHFMLPGLLVVLGWQKERWALAAKERLEARNESLRAEIEERQRVEEQLRSLLEQRTVLFRELNHRVRNNMASILGLVSMETMRGRCKCSDSPLTRIQERIRTISNMNDTLDSADWGEVDPNAVVKTVLNSFEVHPGSNLCLKLPPEPLKVSKPTATVLGQVLAELVSNSLTHASSAEGSIQLAIEARTEDGNFVLEFSDDGAGFSVPVLGDLQKKDNLGLRLSAGLVASSPAAAIRFFNEDGARVTLSLPLSNE